MGLPGAVLAAGDCCHCESAGYTVWHPDWIDSSLTVAAKHEEDPGVIFRRTEPDEWLNGDVRQAHRADIPRVVELWELLMAVHQEVDDRFAMADDAAVIMTRRFHALLHDRDARLLVSVANGTIVGFTLGHVDFNLPFLVGSTIGFISDLYVDESHRHQGRAVRLVEALRSWFRARGVSSIQLHAASCNPESYQFWSRLGFHDFLVRMTMKL